MTTYCIKNTSKSVRTRTIRASTAGVRGSVQRVCGGSIRLGRGDHTHISEEQLNKHYGELMLKQSQGLIEIRLGGHTGPVVKAVPAQEVATAVERVLSTPTVVPTPAPVLEVTDDAEVSIEEPEKPIEKMTKQELIAYAAEVLGERESDLELLTKRQLLEKLS